MSSYTESLNGFLNIKIPGQTANWKWDGKPIVGGYDASGIKPPFLKYGERDFIPPSTPVTTPVPKKKINPLFIAGGLAAIVAVTLILGRKKTS